MGEAEQLCTHVAIMHLGKVAAIGTQDELKAGIGGDEVTLDDVFVHDELHTYTLGYWKMLVLYP